MFSTKLVPKGNITVVHRSTNVMFHVCAEIYLFLHSGITILTEVKNINMKFMKTQDKNIQISVYCIQLYCK
jgi:hypothetical protein